MFEPLKLYATELKLIGLGILCVVIGYLYFTKGSIEKDLIIANNTLAQYKKESDKAIETEKQKTKEQEVISQTVAESYSLQLKQLKDYYAKHPNIKLVYASQLHNTAPSRETFETKLPTTSTGVDEVASNTSSSEEYTPTVEDAAETTLMLESLQQWIREQNKLCNQYNEDK